MDPSAANAPLLDHEREWLLRAVELAERGRGRVRPNPMVGCVLVRDGAIVGEGWHEEFGEAHAEVNALDAARGKAVGATAYVTLEPCNHYGKTPPCTDALLDAGVRRVVYGAGDPGAEAAGGRRRLAMAGVEVSGPPSDPALGRNADPAFFYTTEHGRVYVAVKLAVSRDGRIAEAVGKRSAVTGEEANRYVHQLRSGFDAIVVGAETALVDDPLLTVRHDNAPRVAPTRVVLDSTCRVSPDARLFATIDQAPVLVFVTPAAPTDRVRTIEGTGASVVVVAEQDGRVHLDEALATCWERGLTSVLCEGGGRLASALVREGLVQRLYILEAPVSFGADGVPAFPGAPGAPNGEEWRTVGEPRPVGVDILVSYDREV